MSYQLLVFDPSVNRLRRVRNILITTVSFSTTNTATITIPTGVSPKVYAEATGKYTLTYTYESTTGKLTLTLYKHTVTTTSATVVMSVTALPVSAVTSIDVSTTSILAVSTAITVTVVTSVSYTTTPVVSSVGDDVGKWTVDTTGLASHTHAVSTTTVVAGISHATTTMASISLVWRTFVTSVTYSATLVAQSILAGTTTVVASATYDLVPPASGELPITVEIIVMW